MFIELLEKFEDIFQPHSKEELGKRLWPRIVHAVQDWMGDESTKDGVSEEQIKNVIHAIAMDFQLEEDVNEYIKDLQDEFERNHQEDDDEDIL